MGISGKRPDTSGTDRDSEWCDRNAELLAKADALIGARLADKKHYCDHSNMTLCHEVFSVMQRSLDGTENGSVLLLGEAGSGKTHVVEWCVQQLQGAEHPPAVLHAYGGAYSTDSECLRHLATQATGQLVTPPHRNASFEAGLEWIRSVLAEGFRRASAVLIILDRFEHFCMGARQTLLYNLFDIAQEVGVRLCIVGTSEKMDVMDSLEKRIRSRFSMRHLHTFLPTNMVDLTQVLMAKLRLPASCGLKPAFLKELHRGLEAAICAKAPCWSEHLELGRPPAWFLAQCLPVSVLLRDHGQASLSPKKRLRVDRALVATAAGARELLVSGLSEAEHAVLLALLRRHDRASEKTALSTLQTLLHELRLLHESGGLVAKWDSDLYCSAFDRLLQAKLVELCGNGSAEAGKLYHPCRSLVNHIYTQFVQDLAGSGKPLLSNPLRALPQPLQQWAVRQRRKE